MDNNGTRYLSGREQLLLKDALEAYQPVLVQQARVLAHVGHGADIEQDARLISGLLAVLAMGSKIAAISPREASPSLSAAFQGRVV